MLDDFIINASYDAYDQEFEELMRLWDIYCEEVAVEENSELT